MKWKAVLSLLVVLMLVGVLLTTNFGKGYVDFLRKNVGQFVLPFNLPLDFFPPSGDQFSILLSSNKSPYYGLGFQTANSTFLSKAICVTDVKVNDIYISKADSKCDISLYNARGNFQLTRAGSLVISADATSISVDETYLSGNLKIEVEVIPLEFLLIGVSQERLSLSAVDGEFKRFAADGTVAQANTLKNETITIYNFVGILQLKGSEIDLQGVVSAVESSTFKIPK